jgi:hypothetical protein
MAAASGNAPQISQYLLAISQMTIGDMSPPDRLVCVHYHPVAINYLSDNGHFTSIYALGPLQSLAEYGRAIETRHKRESTAKRREQSRNLKHLETPIESISRFSAFRVFRG